uniref:CHK domain-containing protein n=1 Tax=Trichuris muris TaxID=70415 RepID=A0A5S6R3P2_TRIMR
MFAKCCRHVATFLNVHAELGGDIRHFEALVVFVERLGAPQLRQSFLSVGHSALGTPPAVCHLYCGPVRTDKSTNNCSDKASSARAFDVAQFDPAESVFVAMDFVELNFAKLLETELNRRLTVKRRLNNCCVAPVGQGDGAICNIYVLKLQWDESQGAKAAPLPASVVLKVPRTKDPSELVGKFAEMAGEAQRSEGSPIAQRILKLHNNEVDVYTMFMGESKPQIPVPACFYARKATDGTQGLLVLEDLTDQVAPIDDISSGMNLAKVKQVASILASLQCWCLTTEVQWQRQFPRLFENMEGGDHVERFLRNGLTHLRKQYPDRFDRVDDAVVLKFLDARQWSTLLRTVCRSVPAVLKHGDLWTNNILFKRTASGQPGDEVVALIDWQLTEEGAPLEDLCHLLIWSTSASFRRRHQRSVVNHYYRTLCDRCSSERVALPSFEMFWLAYKAIFPHRAFLLICMFPALVGTVIKTNDANGHWRLEEMVNRAQAAYDDAVSYMSKPNRLFDAQKEEKP